MNTDSVAPNNDPTAELPKTIWSSSFQGLLWTQWLTSINDNVFRWFVIGVGKDQFLPESQGTLLVVGSAFFLIPYIIFAAVAGWLADKYRKSNVIVWCKIAEIVIMAIGVGAVYLLDAPDPAKKIDNAFYLLLFSVFLMGLQSALFAPAKVGTIPELLDEANISKGNGIFNLSTLSATVIGMALGGWLSDVTQRGRESVWIAGLVLVGIAVVGTFLSFLVKSKPAADRNAPFPRVGGTLANIRDLMGRGRLFRVAMGVVFFWAIAGLVQINIDSLCEESGQLFESNRTPLLIAITMGIGFGSVLAGLISAGRIELGLVPWAAIGISVFSILLCFAPADFISESFNSKLLIVCILLAALGMSAGMFDVPLASYLQHNSPIENRGAILAATNCLAFGGILAFLGMMMVLRVPTYEGSLANLPPQLTTESLNDSERTQVDTIVEEFQNSTKEPNKISETLLKVPKDLQPALLSSLVFADAKKRRAAEESVSLETYKDQFPDDFHAQRQIKKVILQSGKTPLFTARQIFLLVGFMTIPVVGYSGYRLRHKMARLFFFWLFNFLYKVKVNGLENIPEGPAILVANHSSWLDGAIPLTFIPGRPRTVAWAGNFKNWFLSKWADFCGLILISGGPKSIRKGMQDAADALENGEMIMIFPEGGISRGCQVRTFRPGFMKIRDKVSKPVPVVPIYIDEVFGSIFSYSGGKAIFKFPKSIRRPLSINIGRPIENPKDVHEVRNAVQRMSSEAHNHYAGKFEAPAAKLVKQCKKRRFKTKASDSTTGSTTGGNFLTRALVLKGLLGKHALDRDEKMVGVLIPPSNGGAIVNVALALDHRVAINLNYSLSQDLINNCIQQANLKHVLTTRKVMEKLDIELDAEIIYLDDFKEKVTSVQKIMAAAQAYLLPGWLHVWTLGLHKIKAEDLMTIVFTSGSTGIPKGVMLSQRNVASNISGIERVACFVSDDTIVGILPFFHSFGFTVALWAAMSCDIMGAFHFSPLDPKQVGKLVHKFKGTILVATPTFLRSYLRRCTVEQFESLDMVVAGAERLPPELSDQFEEKFGVRPVEGYGATELSPIVCVNIPKSRDQDKFQIDRKEGTVGRPLPNVAVKVTDLDTGEEVGVGQSGMLWVKGPNVMQGYLNMEEKTAEVLVDDWYNTGDVVKVDEDGFIAITGRISRFSKIGGEMVPHVKIEELLTKFADETPDDDTDDQPNIAVTSVPDPKKGERLIVLHTAIHKDADTLRKELSEAGLPNIFIPSIDSFCQVESLPLLGSGKLDLKGIKQIAMEKFAPES